MNGNHSQPLAADNHAMVEYGAGASDGIAAAPAAPAEGGGAPLNPSYPAELLGVIPPHAADQLTLSFRGEVFVFESVSPEKVQAVLLLLGGREIGNNVSTSSPLTPNRSANYPHRMASLTRFREKRKERNFDKKIRYDVRKEVALKMQRNKGQFISSKSKPEDAALSITYGDGTQQWGSMEDRPQAAAECHHCHADSNSTPMMRRGPDGPRTLCNACGLMWANKGTLRDISKSPYVPTRYTVPEPQAGSTIIDLSKIPSPSIQNASPELNEGNNIAEVGAGKPSSITINCQVS